MTPRKFFALLEQHNDEMKHTEFMFGQVCSMIVNWSESRPKETVAVSQFMPSQRGKTKPKKVDHQKLSAKIDAIFEPLVKRTTQQASVRP